MKKHSQSQRTFTLQQHIDRYADEVKISQFAIYNLWCRDWASPKFNYKFLAESTKLILRKGNPGIHLHILTRKSTNYSGSFFHLKIN